MLVMHIEKDVYAHTCIDTHKKENTHKHLTDVPSSACKITGNHPAGEKQKVGNEMTDGLGSLTDLQQILS